MPRSDKPASNVWLKTARSSHWRPRQESNLYLEFRKPLFYPLNYGDGDGVNRHEKGDLPVKVEVSWRSGGVVEWWSGGVVEWWSGGGRM
jgi:hypothetical protein